MPSSSQAVRRMQSLSVSHSASRHAPPHADLSPWSTLSAPHRVCSLFSWRSKVCKAQRSEYKKRTTYECRYGPYFCPPASGSAASTTVLSRPPHPPPNSVESIPRQFITSAPQLVSRTDAVKNGARAHPSPIDCPSFGVLREFRFAHWGSFPFLPSFLGLWSGNCNQRCRFGGHCR